jgi:hypothetical protein
MISFRGVSCLLVLFAAVTLEAKITKLSEDDWQKIMKGEWMVEL